MRPTTLIAKLACAAAIVAARGGRLACGADDAPTLVLDIKPGAAGSMPRDFVDMNGVLYFTADDGVHGRELWTSDGTAAGTAMVADIMQPAPGSGNSSDSGIYKLTVLDDTLWFAADDGTHGLELWKSDGSAEGTVMVKDINPGAGDSNPGGFVLLGGDVYFSAATSAAGRELWTTDGTSAGTVLVKDILPGANGSDPTGLHVVGDALVFAADDGTHGSELWTCDGTAAGTHLLKDIVAGSSGSDPSVFNDFGDKLFFVAHDAAGSEPWATDGTTAGTRMLKDVNPGPGDGMTMAGTLTFPEVDGEIFFEADDGVHGVELWKSDGTSAGTTMVKDVYPGANGQWPDNLVEMDGEVYFPADDGTHGIEIWKSDGTAAGTTMVMDVHPGAAGITAISGVEIGCAGDAIWFGADDGTHGTELWTSDGTAEGTQMVTDEVAGAAGFGPLDFVPSGTTLYFSGWSDSGRELYEVTGLSDGGPPPDPRPAIESYFLPKSVTAKVDAKSPAKSTLVATGVFDTGPTAVDLTKAATLDVGGLSFAVPSMAPKKRTFSYAAPGVSFSITPNAAGSSCATFKFTATADLAGRVDVGGALPIRFAGGGIDATGRVLLAKGKYALGKKRGALVAPNLYLAKVSATIKGAGKDALSVLLGLATGGVTPSAAPDLTLQFGRGFQATIRSTSFKKSGNRFTSEGGIGGLTSVVLDYAKETIAIKGKKMTLDTYPDGPQIVRVGIALGAETRAVRVRMAKKGASMKY